MSLGKTQKKKGLKKKVGERFLKKEWWKIRAPGMFAERTVCVAPVNQTEGEKFSHESMKGRVFTVSLGDLNQTHPHKKIKLIVDEEQEKGNKVALTNFYGLDTTRDHLCSLIKKWHTIIDCHVDAKTTDGFLLRVFVTASTKKSKNQQRATSYANSSQLKQLRRIMHSFVSKEVKKCSLKELVPKLMTDTISEDIVKKAKKIFPIQNCLIRKVKTIKRAKFDMTQLLSMHADNQVVKTAEVAKEEVVVADQ